MTAMIAMTATTATTATTAITPVFGDKSRSAGLAGHPVGHLAGRTSTHDYQAAGHLAGRATVQNYKAAGLLAGRTNLARYASLNPEGGGSALSIRLPGADKPAALWNFPRLRLGWPDSQRTGGQR